MLIEYIEDAKVDNQLDGELRALLSRCFAGKPGCEVFGWRRFYKEPVRHRWIIRAAPGRLAAHLAVHEKSVRTPAEIFPVGGVAEACVHPDHRGQGLAKQLLVAAHAFMRTQGWPFSVLFGQTEVYRSSGYEPVTNLFSQTAFQSPGAACEPFDHAMVCLLGSRPWPADRVYLIGERF